MDIPTADEAIAQVVAHEQYMTTVTGRLEAIMRVTVATTGYSGAPDLEELIREIVRDEMAKVST